MSASFRPDRVSMAMMAPSGRNSSSDRARTAGSIPADLNSSIVRTWKCAARGSGDPPRRRSTASDATPCRARNVAVDRPDQPATGDHDRYLLLDHVDPLPAPARVRTGAGHSVPGGAGARRHDAVVRAAAAGAYASQLVTDVEEQVGAAGQLLWAGEVERARAGLDAVIDADDDPVAHLLRGFANFMDDRLQEACRDWEAAFQGFRRAGDFEPAARAALLLAETHTASLGHEAAGQGWLGRARRLLDRIGPCVGHGWYEIALVACTRPDIDDLLESADRALDIALEFGDPDLEIRALADGGLALVSQGRTREGFARLDEALAAITGGQLRDPSIAGNAFCSMLASCDRSGDLRRAEEWNRLIDELVLERLGGRPRILHTHCRAAYGSVLCSAGRWREAEEVMIEALGPDASRALAHRVAITARLAELRIDQGRIEEAARLVEPHAEALEMCSPRARIHLGRAEHDLAVAVAGRALRELVGDAVRRGPLLAVVVQADLGRDDPDSAERAAADLTALADRTESPALVGEAQLARGGWRWPAAISTLPCPA